MQHLLRVILVFVCWFATASLALGQSETDWINPVVSVAERLTQDDGLSNNAVLCLRQDQPGFLWVGTEDGLNRYDGFTFKAYRHRPDQPHSLPGNVVLSLYTTRDGSFWVGCNRAGFCRYDPQTDGFVRYPVPLLYERIFSFYEDRHGNLWVCTDGGLAHLKRPEDELTAYDLKTPDQNIVFDVCEDLTGQLWITTRGGLLHFDPQTKDIEKFLSIVSLEDGKTIGWRIAGLTEEGWLRLVSGEFLVLFDPVRRDCVRQWSTDGEVLDTLPKTVPLERARLPVLWEGQIVWLGKAGGAIVRLDLQKRTAQTFLPNSKRPGALTTRYFQAMLRDRSGVLWIGDGVAGLFKLSPTRNRFELYRHQSFDDTSLSDNYIRAVIEDRQGLTWVATQYGGLNCLDRRTGQVRHYRARPSDPTALLSDAVWAVHEDRQGELWVGTQLGLQRLDRKRGTFQRLPVFPNKAHVNVIFEDPQGSLWVGCMAGLYEVSPDRRRLYDHTPSIQKVSSVQRIDVQTIYASPGDGRIWFGLAYCAICYDPRQRSYREYRVDTRPEYGAPYVTHFTEDQSGTLWVVTKGAGVCRFDTARETFTHITEQDGLPHNNCYAMFPDADGTFWLSSDAGITHCDLHRMSFRTYTLTDGLQGREFNRFSAFRNARGELFFGGTNGLNVFYPPNVVDNPVPPPVALTELRVNSTVLPAWVGMAVQLDYDQNAVDIGYVGLDFHAPEDNRYRCRLEGFDREWREMGGRREVTYTNLSPGRYRFLVIAANHDGVWGPGKVLLTLEIKPPWWKTWPAYVGFVALGSLVVYGGVRLRLRQLVARTRWLEAKVAERTQEVTQKNEELAARNLEIENQRRDMLESLGYAQTIQQAMLPSAEILTAALGEHFVVWKPKDIVSGDFYWLHQQDGEVVLVVADCTGHGVPGAFMSLIGADLLEQIVSNQGIRQPAEILHQLHHGIQRIFKQEERQTLLDGMDAAVCTLCRETSTLTFAGARRPLYVVTDGTLTELKGDRATIGGSSRERSSRQFTSQQIAITPGMMLYLTTDGLADQPDGRGKKFGTRRLRDVLVKVSSLPAAQQAIQLEAVLAAHMGSENQRDDITVVGIRLAPPAWLPSQAATHNGLPD